MEDLARIFNECNQIDAPEPWEEFLKFAQRNNLSLWVSIIEQYLKASQEFKKDSSLKKVFEMFSDGGRYRMAYPLRGMRSLGAGPHSNRDRAIASIRQKLFHLVDWELPNITETLCGESPVGRVIDVSEGGGRKDFFKKPDLREHLFCSKCLEGVQWDLLEPPKRLANWNLEIKRVRKRLSRSQNKKTIEIPEQKGVKGIGARGTSLGRLTYRQYGSDSTVPVGEANPVVRIGKSSDCDIRVRDGKVAEHHAVVYWSSKRGGYYIRSLQEQRSSTYVNGERVARNDSQILADEDQIRCSTFPLTFTLSETGE